MESVVIAGMGMEEWWKDTDSSRKKYSRKSMTQHGIRRRSERATPIFFYLFLPLLLLYFLFS
jgi:hypothetical protein